MPPFDVSQAFSAQALFAASELLLLVPAAALSITPVWKHLRISRTELVCELALILVALLVAAPVVAGYGLSSNYVLYPAAVLCFAAYCRAFDLTLTRKATVFLTLAALGAFITYAALIVDTYTGGTESGSAYLNAWGALTQWGLWALFLAVLARPLHNFIPKLLESPAAGPRFWHIAWLLPAFVVVAVVVLVPEDMTTLFYRRVGPGLVMIMATIFALCVVAYVLMFRLVKRSSEALNAAERLRQTQMQLLMEEHLEERMETARRARHDLRQHDRAISGFLDEGDLEGLRGYLAEHAAKGEDLAPLRVCQNTAVNALAVYYWEEAVTAGAEVTMRLELPRHLPLPEGDVVVVMGNLLENAVEALVAYGPGGTLSVHARMASGSSLFVVVDNSCDAVPDLEGDTIASTKHAGAGLGTQSVRAIAESYDGTATFAYNDGTFRASVMMQGRR